MLKKADFKPSKPNVYPTSDGRPMAETDTHRNIMFDLIASLKRWFADDHSVYVSGNLLVHYERGNKRVHVAPDVFVVAGVGNHVRENYLTWEEGKGLDVVIEVTSKTTMIEDIEEKYNLYVSRLQVKEYFLFDPKEEYLTPSFQGYRRVRSRFQPIRASAGRLPSRFLGLHLERDGTQLRLWDPKTERRIPSPDEVDQKRLQAETEAEQLRREVEALRRQLGDGK